MNGRVFFDTNILLYLYSADEPEKQAVSLQAVHACAYPTVSTQTQFSALRRRFDGKIYAEHAALP